MTGAGVVDIPKHGFQHTKKGPGDGAVMLTFLAVPGVVAFGVGIDAGFGVSIERDARFLAEYFFSRHAIPLSVAEQQPAGHKGAIKSARVRPVAKKAIDGTAISGESRDCDLTRSPASPPICSPPLPGGFAISGSWILQILREAGLPSALNRLWGFRKLVQEPSRYLSDWRVRAARLRGSARARNSRRGFRLEVRQGRHEVRLCQDPCAVLRDNLSRVPWWPLTNGLPVSGCAFWTDTFRSAGLPTRFHSETLLIFASSREICRSLKVKPRHTVANKARGLAFP